MAVTFIEKVINVEEFTKTGSYGEFTKLPPNVQNFTEKGIEIPIPAPVKVKLKPYMFNYAKLTGNKFNALHLTGNEFNYWLPTKGG